MTTRLVLDGPDLRALLAKVRSEHGARARIVSADRLRRGGLGGVFRKPWFELGVEIPGGPPEPGAHTGPPRGDGSATGEARPAVDTSARTPTESVADLLAAVGEDGVARRDDLSLEHE